MIKEKEGFRLIPNLAGTIRALVATMTANRNGKRIGALIAAEAWEKAQAAIAKLFADAPDAPG
jgi:hypothetical protein